MAVKLFGVDMAKKFALAFNSQKALPITLTRVTPGTPTGGNLIGGSNATTAPYPCRGYRGKDSYRQIDPGDGTMAKVKTATVVIFAGSLPPGIVPEADDLVTIGGDKFMVIDVGSDPAEATYRLVAR